MGEWVARSFPRDIAAAGVDGGCVRWLPLKLKSLFRERRERLLWFSLLEAERDVETVRRTSLPGWHGGDWLAELGFPAASSEEAATVWERRREI